MAKRKTHDEFVKDLKIIRPNIEIIGTYINAKAKILCKCLKCDHTWSTTPDKLTSFKTNCIKCYHRSRTKTHEDFLYDMMKINSNITFITKYKNAKTKILCKCDIDDYEWYSTPNSLLNGKGCPMCGGNKVKTNEEFLLELYNKTTTIIPLEQYNGLHNKIKCKCNLCNNEWYVSPANLLHKSNPTGCPICNSSKGEYKISILLKNNGIKYEPQKEYIELVGFGNKKLSYDFYIKESNLLIEYQGEQHKKPVNHFGGEKKFKKQLIYDDLKRKYATKNNINLLEIWYWDFDNIEKILFENMKGGEISG